MTLELMGVSQRYGNVVALREVSARLKPGVTGLLGPNGAGKTTLLRTMATIMPPDAGVLHINGVQVNDERSARSARRHVGYLPQSFGYDPHMRVGDFVRYAAWLRGLPAAQWDAGAKAALSAVDLLDRATIKLKKLSGGMRQRAGIAWAIVGRPAVILLDEPTAGLDPRQRLQFRKILTDLSDSVVVLSTHIISDIDSTCDRVLVISDGQIRFDGSTAELSRSGRDDLPGHTSLERAYLHLLPEQETSR
ncbi:ATP-binding cassette domain-containing protein [Micromonospora maris]|uniref:Multidrug ABC transporter ATP-binding protein n=1 Tax=Micromonospora maris TaxID=1003110 RepID=A0A9X0LF32_9ACTN|nr:ATP-binding cassette domain-containing protein [Micromonospora maris]AEB42412.1 ABC transporter related protein [Micromonospora maris AB-18-032]KUJ47881.1 multidrug ABC transporter ATP-binding protein [Micromonospora maris]